MRMDEKEREKEKGQYEKEWKGAWDWMRTVPRGRGVRRDEEATAPLIGNKEREREEGE